MTADWQVRKSDMSCQAFQQEKLELFKENRKQHVTQQVSEGYPKKSDNQTHHFGRTSASLRAPPAPNIIPERSRLFLGSFK